MRPPALKPPENDARRSALATCAKNLLPDAPKSGAWAQAAKRLSRENRPVFVADDGRVRSEWLGSLRDIFGSAWGADTPRVRGRPAPAHGVRACRGSAWSGPSRRDSRGLAARTRPPDGPPPAGVPSRGRRPPPGTPAPFLGAGLGAVPRSRASDPGRRRPVGRRGRQARGPRTRRAAAPGRSRRACRCPPPRAPGPRSRPRRFATPRRSPARRRHRPAARRAWCRRPARTPRAGASAPTAARGG